MKIYKRKDFIKLVSENLEREYSQEAIYWITKSVYKSMLDIVSNGHKLFVSDCFTLEPKLKAEKRTGNFGSPCVIPAHYEPYFKPLKKMKDLCRKIEVTEDVKISEGRKRDKKNK